MARTYTLESPFLDLEWSGRPDHWRKMFAAWMILGMILLVGLLYLYAVVFAAWVGFETALLVGIGLLVLSNND